MTGLALYLHMNEFLIGLLSAFPFLATVFQLPASYFLEKKGNRKSVAKQAALAARSLWLPVLIVILLPDDLSLWGKSLIVLALIFVSQAFVSVSYVAWLSWISDLVPERIRGRFFGARNMLCGAAGMAAMLLFGYLLDASKSYGKLGVGFTVVFIAAVVFGMLSIHRLAKISDLKKPVSGSADQPKALSEGIRLPFRDANFRRFLLFTCTWSFSVYFASPFFTLYFLRELRYSYAFVALLGTLSALADMVGMQLWGRISDTVKNKAVIHVASWVVIFIPLAWTMVLPESRIMPIVLMIISGGFWSGINLCMNNLLFRIAPTKSKSFYLSVYNMAGGLGAAVSPVLAGLILKGMDGFSFHLFSRSIVPLQLVFLASTLLRLATSRLLLRRFTEPEEVAPIHVLRIIRNIRALNVASGFNMMLHPFIEITKESSRKE